MKERRKIKKIQHAEKIAAGEVVERPANVVKELVENSIDAGAKEIRIIVKKAGKNLIQVIDDGIGIPPDELEYAFKRHTSSKIRSIEDLDSLSTLGFRGEALASIVAVSKVEITTRTKENKAGVKLNLEGGKILAQKEISCPVGVNIKVKNLFYNIPARQKFLKSDSTELGHITDIIQRYALAYPDIHFIYRHNKLDILNCPADNDLKTTAFHIYGKNNAKLMEYLDSSEEGGGFRIYGLLGHPKIAKKSRNYSSLYINNRYIISDLLFRAVAETYKGTLMIGKFPFFILFLQVDPSTVDFNIHPKKLHIRFENTDYIYNKVYNVLRDFIEKNFIQQEAKHLAIEIDEFSKPKDQRKVKEVPEIKTPIEKPIKEIRDISSLSSEISKETEGTGVVVEKSVQTRLTEISEKDAPQNGQGMESVLRGKYILKERFPKLRLISKTGQLSNKVYIVLEGFEEETNEPGLYILDQHAASERINKERFLSYYQSSKVQRQRLISPLKMDVSPSETFFLKENLADINKLGFKFEHFGGNTFILREIPTIMGKLPKREIIKEIVSDIYEIGKDASFSAVVEEVINYLSCHRSIRGGDDLSLRNIRNLLKELSSCEDPFHCAHGRPTLRFLSFKELDKLFKRTG